MIIIIQERTRSRNNFNGEDNGFGTVDEEERICFVSVNKRAESQKERREFVLVENFLEYR